MISCANLGSSRREGRQDGAGCEGEKSRAYARAKSQACRIAKAQGERQDRMGRVLVEGETRLTVGDGKCLPTHLPKT